MLAQKGNGKVEGIEMLRTSIVAARTQHSVGVYVQTGRWMACDNKIAKLHVYYSCVNETVCAYVHVMFMGHLPSFILTFSFVCNIPEICHSQILLKYVL